MLSRGTDRWLAIAWVIAPLLAVPADSEACGFTRLFHRREAAIVQPAVAAPTFQPAVAAPAFPASQPQRVQYVPQTSYRAVRQNVAVTTCRAVTTRDPCTGCPVTSMRPVTTYVQQVRYVPYTTYRAVTVPAACHATAAYAAPTYAAPSNGACCGGTPRYLPAPVTVPVSPSSPPSLVPAPSSSPTPASGSTSSPPTTFKKNVVPTPAVPNPASGGLKPESASSSSAYPSSPPRNTQRTNDRRPKLFDPRDRTARHDGPPAPGPRIRRVSVTQVRAAVPLERASYYNTASPARSQERIDAAGWRAAGR